MHTETPTSPTHSTLSIDLCTSDAFGKALLESPRHMLIVCDSLIFYVYYMCMYDNVRSFMWQQTPTKMVARRFLPK